MSISPTSGNVLPIASFRLKNQMSRIRSPNLSPIGRRKCRVADRIRGMQHRLETIDYRDLESQLRREYNTIMRQEEIHGDLDKCNVATPVLSRDGVMVLITPITKAKVQHVLEYEILQSS
ncbi:hypothetical protein Lal_00013469, partial [Lupinus albus]